MNRRLWIVTWRLVALGCLIVACGEDAEESLDTPTSQIAFVSDRRGYRQIYVMDADGGNQRPLTDPQYGDDTWPAWSPDGTRIAFLSSRTGEPEMFMMDADGRNQRNISNSRGGADGPPTWSPDGGEIAQVFSQYHGAVQMRVTDADGGNMRAFGLPAMHASRAQWTPDGSRIVFDSPRTVGDGGMSASYVIDADGENLELLDEGPGSDRAPVWSPDGSRVAIVPRDPEPRIVVQDADGGNRRTVTNAATGGDFGPSWSPDGRSIAFVASDRSYVNPHRRELSSGADIHVVNLDDMTVRRLTESRDYDGMPSWSP